MTGDSRPEGEPVPPPAPRSKASYLPTLDGWRGIAILMVLAGHDLPYHLGPLVRTWQNHSGSLGVEIFFALSGVLICTRLLQEENLTGRIRLKQFYLRRLFRIQPASLFFLLVLSLIMFTGAVDRRFEGVAESILLVRNYLPLHLNVADYYTMHFWSLSVEEHFYLMLPPFLVLFRTARVRLLCAAIALLVAAELILGRSHLLNFGWAPTAHTEFAVRGILFAALLAVVLQKPGAEAWCRRWFQPYLLLMATALLISIENMPWARHLDLLREATLPIVIVSTMLRPSAIISRFLELNALRAIGRVSYSLYLWQELFFLGPVPVPIQHSALLATLQGTWLRYPVTVGLAIASYYLIEKPLVRMGHRVGNSGVPGRAG